MTPRRTALVGPAPAFAGAPARVTLPRLPWEAAVTGPDPRDDTRPVSLPIRHPVRHRAPKPVAERFAEELRRVLLARGV